MTGVTPRLRRADDGELWHGILHLADAAALAVRSAATNASRSWRTGALSGTVPIAPPYNDAAMESAAELWSVLCPGIPPGWATEGEAAFIRRAESHLAQYDPRDPLKRWPR